MAEIYSLNELRDCYRLPNTHPNTSCCSSSFIQSSAFSLPFLRSAQAVRQCVMCCPGWIREKKQRKVASQAIGVLWLGQYGRSFFQASQQSGDVSSLTGISWEVHSGKVYTASSLVSSRDCLMGQTQPAIWPHCNPALNLRI